MEYFHVDHGNHSLLKVGTTIRTSDMVRNPYYESIRNQLNDVQPVFGQPRKLLEFLRSVDTSKFTREQLAAAYSHNMNSYIRVVRELEFENVRRESYALRPSRHRCLWLAQSSSEAKSWQEQIGKAGPFRILRVFAEGNMFLANEGHLQTDSCAMNELESAAHRYWSGEPSSGRCEILLEGAMTVLDEER